MLKVYGRVKQCSKIVISLTALLLAITAQPAKADASDHPYLENIQNYTNAIKATSNSILTAINTIFAYMTQLNLLATSWLAADNDSTQPIDWSTQWSNEQNWLASLGSSALNNESNQYAATHALMTNFFGASNLQASPPIPQNINDLSYTTLLGQPLITPDPRSGVDPAMNYLINASGLGLPLTVPSAGFRGPAIAQKNYVKFYNTMTAVQTYNGFVLSRLYQDSKSSQNDRSLRSQLITQSTNSNWFSAVITNDLGWVLRQMLLYNSQMYVLMDQLVQSQKQMAATLAMTNTLFIINNEIQGNLLLKQAEGT